jgi:hypothetical protein
VQIDTSTAGSKAGSVIVNRLSDGTGTSGLTATASGTNLGSDTITVTGAGYLLAAGDASNPLNFGAARVGDAALVQALNIANTAAASGGFTETLTADIDAAPFNYATATNQVSGIAAVSSTNVDVTLNTDTAGDFSGQILGLTYTSNEVGGSGLGDSGIGGENVTLNGKVYAAAVADVQTPSPVDFGVVRKGDLVAAQAVSIGNSVSGALTDVLTGGFGAVDGPFTGSGDLGTGVAAGDTDTSSLTLGLGTATAGVFSGTAAFDLNSHNDDMSDIAALATDLLLTAQVNELASPEYQQQSGDGSLSGGGLSFVFDFGDILEGSTTLLDASLALLNEQLVAVDPGTGIIAQDNLDGAFGIPVSSVFDFSNFDDFIDLIAGGGLDDLLIEFDPTGRAVGTYSDRVFLDGLSTYTGLGDVVLPQVELLVRARVVQGGGSVPLPSILFLFMPGLGGLLWLRRRRGSC